MRQDHIGVALGLLYELLVHRARGFRVVVVPLAPVLGRHGGLGGSDRPGIAAVTIVAHGVSHSSMKELGLCAGISDARYTSTTEVFPDSPRAVHCRTGGGRVCSGGFCV